MAERKNTKTQILDQAEALLQEKGFSAFSYHHIAENLGIKNAAIHYHFPSKSDLGTALIQRYQQQFLHWTTQQREKNIDPATMLKGYMTIPLSYMRSGGKVCPLGVLETEFNAISDDMRVATRELDKEMRDFLTLILEEARSQGQVRFEGSPADKALLLTATMQGALQIARVAGPRTFMNTLRLVQKELGLTQSSRHRENPDMESQ